MARQTKKVGDVHELAVGMRKELARRIAAQAQAEGETNTDVANLALYRRTAQTSCFRASYEPGLTVFVQGRKYINLGGTEFFCDGSSFLLSSIDVPAQSQIIEASEWPARCFVPVAISVARRVNDMTRRSRRG